MMKRKTILNMTTGSPIRLLIQFAIPLLHRYLVDHLPDLDQRCHLLHAALFCLEPEDPAANCIKKKQRVLRHPLFEICRLACRATRPRVAPDTAGAVSLRAAGGRLR